MLYIIRTKITKAIKIMTIIAMITILSPACCTNIYASSANGFNAGYIITDSIFTNRNSMTVADIQNFLNSKVTSCRAGYICLKNYTQNGISSAQIIYNAAQQYNINPQVLIVLLQKEEGLVTDTWPEDWQYKSATGYGCPDTSVCDSEYYGLTNQINNSAKMFHAIMVNSSSWYTPYILGSNYIQYNPASSCGGSTIDIKNRATQALYNYTPYQPNQAALDAGYGNGDSCSSYGNRNFYLYFTDWFGSTIDTRLDYSVIQGDSSAAVYMQTSAGKYYVPSYEILNEWGFSVSDIKIESQALVDGIKTVGQLSNVLTDGCGNLFIVENGTTHQVLSPNYTSLWNVDTSNMVESLGLYYKLDKGNALGRFISLKGGDGSVWLIDGTKKHLVPSNMLYLWGYYPGITNAVSSNLFSRYTDSSTVTQYASSDNGSTIWAIDASLKRPFKDKLTQNAYVTKDNLTSVNDNTLSMMAQGSSINRFVLDSTTGQWFLVDLQTKHYIQYGDIATVWGKLASESPSSLSNVFLSNITTSDNASFTAQSDSTNRYWLIANDKHYIPTGDIYKAISGSSTSPTVYSEDLLASLPTGDDASYNITSDSPYNYPYMLDNGVRRYTSLGSWGNSIKVPVALMHLITEGKAVQSVVSDGTSSYYIENGYKYLINPAYYSSWNINSQTTVVSPESLNRFSDGGQLTDILISKTGNKYIISGGKKLVVGKFADAYPSNIFTTTQIDGSNITTGSEVSYLIKSTNTLDSRVWFVNNGTKTELTSFEQEVALGYLSNNVSISMLSETTINNIPNATTPFSLLIQNNGSGIKFVNFGAALSFDDGSTLISYVNQSAGVLQVSSSIYKNFTLSGSASCIVYDDMGRYWKIENGQKRYITSWDAFNKKGYTQVKSRYLYGITMNLIPVGDLVD